VTDHKNVELFSDAFNKHVDDFKNFCSECLQLRSTKSEIDFSTEFSKFNERVKAKIEDACVGALKEEIS
jgi:hypothetical protein